MIKDLIGIFIVIIFIGGILYGFGYLIYDGITSEKECADKLGKEWSHWGRTPGDIRREYIDEDHYNCCWKEVELTNDGYYKKEKCKGFIKEK